MGVVLCDLFIIVTEVMPQTRRRQIYAHSYGNTCLIKQVCCVVARCNTTLCFKLSTYRIIH